MEVKFADVDLANRAYHAVVRRIIDAGTTTCCYYGSQHLGATKVLADIVHSLGSPQLTGQRAFVGKCNMDRNSAPNYTEASADSSIQDTQALIAHIEALPRTNSDIPLVLPILTPRFAISCTAPLLSGLGDLARSKPSVRIQTHISENKLEIQFTKELFPDSQSYAAVYDSFGLLRGNTILAHACHLEEDEMALIKERNAGISHCPTSNFHLNSGVAPVGEFLDRGIKPCRLVETTKGAGYKDQQLSLQALLYLATLGGARVCDLEDQIGSFAPGKSFDALVVDVRNSAGNPALWGVDSEPANTDSGLDGMLERFFFCGDDRNISSVYVQGRLIGGTSR
ncbi:hypothetical protein VNI00_003137 [Paramarasmius palmivorus]|uniref:Amidohydrolase-related domain-containing protein n=1 Tax=Paramarasmius palmivorus TaxID=297713 RepID=A0AAW0DT39_9AGAR